MKFFDYILRKLGLFDSNGLKHSKKHLATVKYSIAFKTLTEQSSYADKTTVDNIKNTDFILLSCVNLIEKGKMDYYVKQGWITTPLIGNLAFIALNANNKEIRNKCIDLLEEYRIYVKNNPII